MPSILGSFYRRAARKSPDPEAHRASLRYALSRDLRVLLDRRLGLPQGTIDRIARIQLRA